MIISRNDYIGYTKELCVSKNSSNEIYIPVIPCIKEEIVEQTIIRIFLTSDSGSQGQLFVVFCPESNLLTFNFKNRWHNDRL